MLRYTPVADLDYGTLSCWAENNIAVQSVPCLFQVVAAGEVLVRSIPVAIAYTPVISSRCLVAVPTTAVCTYR